MTSRTFHLLIAVTLAVVVTALAASGGASAHEQRTIGEYDVEVGFFEEPALVNQLNGVFLEVSREGEPVEGLDETLKVELIVGGGAETKELAFEAIEGEPGSYVAKFLPTLAGDYTFRIFGNIEALQVDESFESGPGRFDSVESLDEIAFPEAPGDNASLGQTVEELQTKVDGLEGSDSSDSTARMLGIAGLVVGLAGLGAGGFAAMRRKG
ncbi:MAG TPA: hypothetical protein VFO59_08895 [Dehalococcoidia bacterium]|nr:hypothetical protein [Dehalococcoidia bacterium]